MMKEIKARMQEIIKEVENSKNIKALAEEYIELEVKLNGLGDIADNSNND